MALPMVPQMFKNHSQVIFPVSFLQLLVLRFSWTDLPGVIGGMSPPPPNICMLRFDKKRFLAVSITEKLLYLFSNLLYVENGVKMSVSISFQSPERNGIKSNHYLTHPPPPPPSILAA